MKAKMKNIMKHYKILTLIMVTLVLVLGSCVKDLNTVPLDPDEVTSASVYENPDSYYQVLAKLYAVFSKPS